MLRIIGSGVSFPFKFSEAGRVNSVSVSKGVQKVNQSIHSILTTRKGERIFMPEFGSNLHLLVFEPLDDFLYPQLRVETAEALRRWERRIRVTGISFVSPREVSAETLLQLGTPPEAITRLQERSWIGIFIQYEILQYHVKGAYIYPFELAALPFEQTTGRTSIGGA